MQTFPYGSKLEREVEALNLAGSQGPGGPSDAAPTDGSPNVVTSKIVGKEGWHAPVLDIDFPAFLIPSSTPGHSHLYLDRPVREYRYWKLMEALAIAGIVQPGYVNYSQSRGFSCARFPWIKKSREQLEFEANKKF